MKNLLYLPYQDPENYGPSQPKILTKALSLKKQISDFPIIQSKRNTIDNIIPTHNPKVGSCEFLVCFTSMAMMIDYDSYITRPFVCLRYGSDGNYCSECGLCDRPGNRLFAQKERFYRAYLLISGVGLINTFSPIDNINTCQYAVDNFLKNTFDYAGYSFRKIGMDEKDDLIELTRMSIDFDRPVLCLCRDEKHKISENWKLIVGYDTKENTFSFCDEHECLGHPHKDWENEIMYVYPTIELNKPKPSFRQVLINAYKNLRKSEFMGYPCGLSAYIELRNFLSNSNYYESASDDILLINYIRLNEYFVTQAEARCLMAEGLIAKYYENDSESAYLNLREIADVCWNYHKAAWNGWMALKGWPNFDKNNFYLLRDKNIRDSLYKQVEIMSECDIKILNSIKILINKL